MVPILPCRLPAILVPLLKDLPGKPPEVTKLSL
jgi:hypothetical protein